MDSIKSLDKTKICKIFYVTDELLEQQYNSCFVINNNKLNYSNKILCNAFYESSTRTSMSFESANVKIRRKTIYFNTNTSSLNKGETFEDTMKTIQEFCDIIVLRHPKEENIFHAISFCKVPIINGGNGSGEHPTQALLDLYTIRQNINITKIFHICFIGDITYSRTIHSLIDLLGKMNIQCIITFCCYPECHPDNIYIENLKSQFGDNNIFICDDFKNSISDYDIFYCTRNQVERHNSNSVSRNAPFDIKKWQIEEALLEKMKKNAIILHPLPRNDEIHPNVDNNTRAKYFDQVKNGIYIRMAILHNIFNNYDTLIDNFEL